MPSRYKSGYTFIEILIVVVIVAILLTVGVASYSNFRTQRKVVDAANELKLVLRTASANANNNVKDCSTNASGGCGGNTAGCSDPIPADNAEKDLDAWVVDLDELKIYGECGGDTFSEEDILADFSELTITPMGTLIIFNPRGEGAILSVGGAFETTAVDVEINAVPVLTIDPSGSVSDYVED